MGYSSWPGKGRLVSDLINAFKLTYSNYQTYLLILIEIAKSFEGGAHSPLIPWRSQLRPNPSGGQQREVPITISTTNFKSYNLKSFSISTEFTIYLVTNTELKSKLLITLTHPRSAQYSVTSQKLSVQKLSVQKLSVQKL